MYNYITELLNIAPEYIKIAFWACCSIGAMVLWHFRKYVLVIGSGVVLVYVTIKNAIAGDD